MPDDARSLEVGGVLLHIFSSDRGEIRETLLTPIVSNTKKSKKQVFGVWRFQKYYQSGTSELL